MAFLVEVALGSVMLVLCTVLHVAAIIVGMSALRHLLSAPHGGALWIGLITILGAHTLQIWAWALVFQMMGAVESFEASFYFAITTYTTLGYGDLLLEEGRRVFATFASITGLLAFGISTAFLVSIITRLLPQHWRD